MSKWGEVGFVGFVKYVPFLRCERPSCDGCMLKPVRSLRRMLKAREMEKKAGGSEADDALKRAEAAAAAIAGAGPRKASASRKVKLLVPREEIPWYPTIKPDLCNGCGDCQVLCKAGVFEPGPPDPAGIQRPKFVVAHPERCVVLCDKCVPVCTSGGIVMPDPKSIEKYIEYVDE
ncbi:4Fe-4S dicluster protein [Prosthecochloris sp. CIB 2401]|nr:4Fe-4S dicluster protein [Prosthecochloris sp. CIB 2401]